MHVCFLKRACNADNFLHLSSYLQKKKNLSSLVVSFVGSRHMCVLSLHSFKVRLVASLEL